MFMVETLSGINAQSVSLMAEAIDIFGDAMNYGIYLAVLSMSLTWRARAALFKGLTMGSFGLRYRPKPYGISCMVKYKKPTPWGW
jgi:hypothetical protein